MGQVRNQRFIVNFFVVADLVRVRDGARGDLRKVAGLERGGSVFARIDSKADGLGLGGDHVAEELPACACAKFTSAARWAALARWSTISTALAGNGLLK